MALVSADGTFAHATGAGARPAASEPKINMRALKAEVKAEVKAELKSVGRQSLSTRTMAEMYRLQLSGQLLRLVPRPTWFAPDPVASATTWTLLPANTSEGKVQQQLEHDVGPLAAASRGPTLVLLGRSTVPSVGTRKPDMVGYCTKASAAPADAQPQSTSVTHVVCLGSLKHRRAAGNEGRFNDEEKGGALNFGDALMRLQPWRAHSGSLARVVVFLSDGAHIVFFECTFRVRVDGQQLLVDATSVLESAPLPLNGLGSAYLAGITQAPLDALGYSLPQYEVDGAPVQLRAYLGMGATSHGFSGTWRGEDVILKRYHADTPPDVAAREVEAHHAAAGVPGVCQLRGHADGCLLLAPCGAVAYSLHAQPAAAPPVPASAGLWSPALAAAKPPPADVAEPVLPGAAEFCDLLDALAGLHAAGWVHRDPRPANFFRDAAGRFFLADLGSAARIGDAAAAAADARAWAPQYGPLAALRAAAAGAPPPAPAPAHDFEQVARLVYTCARGVTALRAPDDAPALCAWWEQRDTSMLLEALLPAAAAAPQGDAARRVFKELICKVLQ